MGTVEPQTVNIMDMPDKPAPKPKPLTRQQKRLIQRIELEAHQTLARLSDSFVDFFMDSDEPEGKEVDDKFTEINAKWKAYCHRRRLNESAYEFFEREAAIFIKAYLDAKRAKEPQLEL